MKAVYSRGDLHWTKPKLELNFTFSHKSVKKVLQCRGILRHQNLIFARLLSFYSARVVKISYTSIHVLCKHVNCFSVRYRMRFYKGIEKLHRKNRHFGLIFPKESVFWFTYVGVKNEIELKAFHNLQFFGSYVLNKSLHLDYCIKGLRIKRFSFENCKIN